MSSNLSRPLWRSPWLVYHGKYNTTTIADKDVPRWPADQQFNILLHHYIKWIWPSSSPAWGGRRWSTSDINKQEIVNWIVGIVSEPGEGGACCRHHRLGGRCKGSEQSSDCDRQKWKDGNMRKGKWATWWTPKETTFSLYMYIRRTPDQTEWGQGVDLGINGPALRLLAVVAGLVDQPLQEASAPTRSLTGCLISGVVSAVTKPVGGHGYVSRGTVSNTLSDRWQECDIKCSRFRWISFWAEIDCELCSAVFGKGSCGV